MRVCVCIRVCSRVCVFCVYFYPYIGKGRGNTKSAKFKAGEGFDDGIRFLREPIGERAVAGAIQGEARRVDSCDESWWKIEITTER